MPNFRIDLGHARIGEDATDADYQREARRLLPGVLENLGEKAGETAWKQFQKGMRGSGLKVSASSSEKRKFVSDAGKKYRRGVNSNDKRKIEAEIIRQLKAANS